MFNYIKSGPLFFSRTRNTDFPILSEIFSFYKEEKGGETQNYVSQIALLRGVTKHEVLRGLLDETSSTIRRMQGMLTGPERWAWDEFIVGYTQFHLESARYLMREVVPELF